MSDDEVIERAASAIQDAWIASRNGELSDEDFARITLSSLRAGDTLTNGLVVMGPQQSGIRLMNDDERIAAGLDPNGGFDGPTGAD